MNHVNQLFALFDECIRPIYRIPESGEGLVICEQDKGSDCPRVLVKKEGSVRAYTFEPGSEIMPYLNSQLPGLTKMCDAVIFYPRFEAGNLTIFVFLCELKSGPIQSSTKQGAIQQVHAGRLFASFLLAKLAFFGNLTFEITYRALLISPKTDKRFRVAGHRSRASYHENRDLKWTAHNADYPIHLKHYCH